MFHYATKIFAKMLIVKPLSICQQQIFGIAEQNSIIFNFQVNKNQKKKKTFSSSSFWFNFSLFNSFGEAANHFIYYRTDDDAALSLFDSLLLLLLLLSLLVRSNTRSVPIFCVLM